jgi:hypothetical protein
MTAIPGPKFGPHLPNLGRMSRDPGDYPILGVSTQSVTQTMGRL